MFPFSSIPRHLKGAPYPWPVINQCHFISNRFTCYLYALGSIFKRCICPQFSRNLYTMNGPSTRPPSIFLDFFSPSSSSHPNSLAMSLLFLGCKTGFSSSFVRMRVLCSHACALASFGKCYTLPHWWLKLGQSKSFVPVAPVVVHALVGAYDDIHTTLSLSRHLCFRPFPRRTPLFVSTCQGAVFLFLFGLPASEHTVTSLHLPPRASHFHYSP
jgi:hypothetical protein